MDDQQNIQRGRGEAGGAGRAGNRSLGLGFFTKKNSHLSFQLVGTGFGYIKREIMGSRFA